MKNKNETPKKILKEIYDRAVITLPISVITDENIRERVEHICRCTSNRAGVPAILIMAPATQTAVIAHSNFHSRSASPVTILFSIRPNAIQINRFFRVISKIMPVSTEINEIM